MHLEITRIEGLRNDLLLRLERSEIESTLLSVANRDRLMALPGLPRHRPDTPAEAQGLNDAKILLEDHLQQLGITDQTGRARRRAVAITNRNLGTNHGHVAWQRTLTPKIFHIREDPLDEPGYPCFVVWRDGGVAIADLRFDVDAGRIVDARDGRDVGDEIEWATSGQRVLRGGQVARVDDIADRFYDIRHVLAFDHHREEGERIRREIYRDYPRAFRDNVRRAWHDLGVPRARYFHNAIGLSGDALVVVQREGTIEEIGAALRAARADDGIILDNGGSVACWVWWANQYAGGLVSPTVDYRPPGTSAIAFVLKGPARVDPPGGSVAGTVN
jgi:hypothetical protein